LLLAFVVAGCHRQAPPDPVVYLDRSRNWLMFVNDVGYARPLARELVRQAFLQAARDELGLTTRDAWLGDPMPTEGNNPPWDVAVTLGPAVTVKVIRGVSPNQAEFCSHELDGSIRKRTEIDYQKLTELEETLSRTGFVEALRKAGHEGKANVRNEKLAVPEPIERLLGEMSFVSQFRAVRELHSLMHEQGESPALLGALSRGYANLGVLTEFFWHPAHRVFKARALLYAQRLAAGDAKSPLGKWHRAYAAALVGLPRWAEADLKAADEAWQAMPQKDRPPRPAWLPLVGPLCRYEIAALQQHVMDPQIGQLAALLEYLAVDQAGGQIWAVQTAIQSLSVAPECYRIWDSLCEFGGVSILHRGTMQPIKVLGEKLYHQLDAMSGLPDDVQGIVNRRLAAPSSSAAPEGFGDLGAQFAGEFKDRRQLVDALLTSSKPPAIKAEKAEGPKILPARGEPSWAALGLLLRELSYMQVYRRAYFERHCLCMPTEAWLAAAAPLVENHPYQAFLDTLAWESGKVKEAAARLAKVDITGLEENAARFYCAFEGNDPARGKLSREMCENEDFTVRDFVTLVRLWQQEKGQAVPFAETLLRISPLSPFARSLLIQHGAEKNQANAAAWDKTAASYPQLSSMLGLYYMNAGRWNDAERCFKAAIKIVPGNSDYYRQLAEVYKLQGQTGRWLRTLKEYLEQPDYTLAHFRVKSDIAYHFMQRKEWEKALPYAEGAAECYSSWGLCCAAECYEGLQRWAEAEKFYQAESERYRTSSLTWYSFCRRTGEGDLEAARRLAREFVKNLAQMPGEPDLYDLTTFYLLEGQPKEAMRSLEQAIAKNPYPSDALWLALIADQCKDLAGRELAFQCVKSLATAANNQVTAVPDWGNALCELIVKDLAYGGKGKIDPVAADKVGASLGGYQRSWSQ
jgi:tetratricopeptide (TPR) repeat protein